MVAYALDWLNLLLRWAHVAAAIVWLGAAFYLLSLDKQPEGRPWIMWPAYLAWLTGFALLGAMYYLQAELYLVDPRVMALPKWGAIVASLALLVAGLGIYEAACRLVKTEPVLSVLLLCLLALTAWGLTLVYSGRGAFIHYGALLGTIMAGNVAHVHVPVARRAAQALKEGRAPDPIEAARARQRSVHNGYLALPVLFAMISNHHASVFGGRWASLALIALTAAGLLVYAGLIARGGTSVWTWIGAALAIALPAAVIAPRQASDERRPEFSEVKRIIDARCVACHAERPSYPGIAEAPKGVKLDTAERIRAQAMQIHRQSVLTRVMPPGNLTRLTAGERALLERWVRAGARSD
ncbi:MAG TPA: urate hydroxylase PuuD [Burkholderiales bacterium]|nr:urate hydroxylase PuuD [Burkholderiales bacterium]